MEASQPQDWTTAFAQHLAIEDVDAMALYEPEARASVPDSRSFSLARDGGVEPAQAQHSDREDRSDSGFGHGLTEHPIAKRFVRVNGVPDVVPACAAFQVAQGFVRVQPAFVRRQWRKRERGVALGGNDRVGHLL